MAVKSWNLAIVLAVAAGSTLSVSAQSTSWLDATSGDWDDPARWDNGVPGAGFDVVINATGAAYTSTVGSTFDINDLLLDSADATLRLANSGVLNLSGTATIASGTLRFDGGRIVGGTLAVDPSGVVSFSSNSNNILDGVAVLGGLELDESSSALRIRNGTSVSGTIGLTGNGARLGFEGTQTFSGTIAQSLGNSAQVTIEGTSTLTFGAGASISGTRLDIGSAFAIGGDRALINDGTISANSANSTGVRLLSMTSMINNGLLEATNGGRLQVLNSVGSFANDGMMTADAGSSLAVGAGSWTNGGSIAGTGASVAFDGSWENLGTVSVTGGSLDLGGAFTTAGSGFLDGRVDRTGSTVTLSGTLDNTGATLSTADLGGLVTLNGGRIIGGSLTVADRADLGFSSNSGNIMEGVAVAGNLELALSSSALRLRDGTSVSGAIHLTGNGARLGLEGTQTFNGTIVQSSGNSAQVTIEGTSVATIGAGSLVTGTRLDIGSAFAIGGTRSLVNRGTFSADGANTTGMRFNSIDTLTNDSRFEAVNGGRLTVLSSVDDFTNLDAGVLSGGVYRIGAESRMDLGAPIVNNAAEIELLGTNATLVGLDTLATNTGSLTLGGPATLDLAGGIVFGPDGVFRLAIRGAGDSAITPLLSVGGVAELGGDLVLDFSGYSLGGITGATTYTFLTGASFTGAFASVDVLGLDPTLVSFDGGPGTFTLVPAPGAGVLFGLAAVRVTRRRRAGC
jgi:hypothetical protein